MNLLKKHHKHILFASPDLVGFVLQCVVPVTHALKFIVIGQGGFTLTSRTCFHVYLMYKLDCTTFFCGLCLQYPIIFPRVYCVNLALTFHFPIILYRKTLNFHPLPIV